MSDEKFPVPQAQRIEDDLVSPPTPPEITDEMVSAGAASETPAGFYDDQARVRAAQAEAEPQVLPAVEAEEPLVSVEQGVNELIQKSTEFQDLNSELSRTDLSFREKMAAIDNFIEGSASDMARDNGVFTKEEILALPVIEKLTKVSQHLFELAEEKDKEERTRNQRDGSRLILEDARENVANGDLKDASTEEKRKFLEGQFLSAIRNAPGLVDDIPGVAEFRKFMSEFSKAAAEEQLSTEDDGDTEAPQDEEVAPENQTSDNQEQILSGPTDNGAEQKPGLFSRIKSSLGSLRSRISQRVERFIHGDSLSSINGIVSSAQLDRTPRTPDVPEREEEVRPEEAPEVVSRETPAVTEQEAVVAPREEVAPEAPEEVPSAEASPEQEQDEEADKNAVTQEIPREPVAAEQAQVEESPASAIDSLVSRLDVKAEQKPGEVVSPESRAFDAAIDFTEKAERFIAGMGDLDYAKGYSAFAERMADLLGTPEGLNPEDFTLTQDRIMYRIARDESFPKQARELLVQLLEKRGAVKVEDRGDGKKVIRRLVSYGDAAKEVLREAKSPERRAARAAFARKQTEI